MSIVPPARSTRVGAEVSIIKRFKWPFRLRVNLLLKLSAFGKSVSAPCSVFSQFATLGARTFLQFITTRLLEGNVLLKFLPQVLQSLLRRLLKLLQTFG